MVGVPGSSGDSGFHREFQEDVKVKEEHTEEVPTNAGSTEASLNTARSTDQRSLERISADRHEADLDQDPDLEEKPRIPLKTALAVTADLDENLDPYNTDKDTTKFKSNLSTKPAVSTRSTKKKKIKAARTKLKAPDSGSEDAHKPRSTIANDLIEQAYHRKILSETLLQDPVLAIIQVRQIGDLTGPISKPNTSTDRLTAVKILLDLLQEAGLVAGEFDPDALFEMELGAIQADTQDRYESLKILVGEDVQAPDLNYQTGSSHYASATSEPDSDSPRAPQRMSLGPSGAKYLRSRVNRPDQRPAASSRTPEKSGSAGSRLGSRPAKDSLAAAEEKLISTGGASQNPDPARSRTKALPQISEFSRSNAEVALDLKRGECRGYWKRHAPGKWFRQAKISGRINQERAILLLDTGAEVSTLNTTFARKVGFDFDTSQRQECVGIGDNVYTTEERTRIKITLGEYLVYFFDIWIGDIPGQNAILGMDFMVPAGVRMDLADGSMRVGIPLNVVRDCMARR
ncbi:hypothetical protein PHMEG_00029254 [Phytophthora megakarya]|uniref:Peptidase A2 domain-containing protein n=1 Tax=Phytophthora megakarya TaxID=4795 RepID=A0A225V1J1_9STRA|nr:hypothetical protein PHMEG_00029254 [Phytophthora megakarya]